MITNSFYLLGLSLLSATGLILSGGVQSDGSDDSSRQIFENAKDLEDVKKTINDVFAWAVTKDFDLFFRTIADDSDFISVTPYKRVKIGVDAVKQDTTFWANPKFKAIRHEIRDLKIVFSESGEVAWFYGVLDDINEWEGQPANWENVRWTGVLERRHGKWRVVQQHFSWPREQ